THSAAHEPRMTVRPGERFQVETELATGAWLQTIDSDPEGTASTFPYVNPTTGPVFIEGTKPGDMLVVLVEKIEVEDLGYTQIIQGHNPFINWVRKEEWGNQFKVVRISDGVVHWSETLKLPVTPMIGTIGTAPEIGAITNADNGLHGGNMDIQEVAEGNTLFLPVFVEGALLHMGDVHAIQGDGELCCGGGIEARSTLTVSVEVAPKPTSMTWPRIETPTHIATVGCARPLEDAFRISVEEMIYWLGEDYGLSQPNAVMLLGQIAEARCTQLVDPKYSYICKVRKSYLDKL
ncbi:MAG: acetamidase/formamidase family protein, partial [Spirochaetota bacterium]